MLPHLECKGCFCQSIRWWVLSDRVTLRIWQCHIYQKLYEYILRENLPPVKILINCNLAVRIQMRRGCHLQWRLGGTRDPFSESSKWYNPRGSFPIFVPRIRLWDNFEAANNSSKLLKSCLWGAHDGTTTMFSYVQGYGKKTRDLATEVWHESSPKRGLEGSHESGKPCSQVSQKMKRIWLELRLTKMKQNNKTGEDLWLFL